MEMWQMVGGWLAFMNALAFLMYGIDKWKAINGWWRISELTLLLLAILGGSVGAFAAMQVFRHKTRHVKFQFGVPMIFMLQLLFSVYFWYHFHP